MNSMSMSFLRENFLAFMQAREYRRIRADYLISEAFPTTFNVSGGPNFAEQYLDENAAEGQANVTIQHCLRHWDFENAGDGSHLSFFEMGVTTAFDEFPQRRLFRDHMDFILNYLKFPRESLHINVFGGGYVRGAFFEKDSETEETWRSLGVDPRHIYLIPQDVPEEIAARLKAEKGADAVEREAFVANAVEPVGGPRTEIFIDRGLPSGCEPRCLPGFCTCGRFIEFWTSVHYTVRVTPVAHERDRQGEQLLVFSDLPPNANIYAAAFGFERVVQIALNKTNIYEFEPLAAISHLIVAQLGRVPAPSEMRPLWAAADHLRGLTFLIAEGVHNLSGKVNRSRKYQYRRYLKSLRCQLDALGLSGNCALIQQVVRQVITTHLSVPPYQEIYNATYVNADEIAGEICARLAGLKPE